MEDTMSNREKLVRIIRLYYTDEEMTEHDCADQILSALGQGECECVHPYKEKHSDTKCGKCGGTLPETPKRAVKKVYPDGDTYECPFCDKPIYHESRIPETPKRIDELDVKFIDVYYPECRKLVDKINELVISMNDVIVEFREQGIEIKVLNGGEK
jgi:hypothetical protein